MWCYIPSSYCKSSLPTRQIKARKFCGANVPRVSTYLSISFAVCMYLLSPIWCVALPFREDRVQCAGLDNIMLLLRILFFFLLLAPYTYSAIRGERCSTFEIYSTFLAPFFLGGGEVVRVLKNCAVLLRICGFDWFRWGSWVLSDLILRFLFKLFYAD